MEKTLKLVEVEQYDNEGMNALLLFYIDGKKEGSARLHSERKFELPEDKKVICNQFNPIVDFAPIEKITWSKESVVEEDNISEWLNSFGYDSSVIGKLY